MVDAKLAVKSLMILLTSLVRPKKSVFSLVFAFRIRHIRMEVTHDYFKMVKCIENFCLVKLKKCESWKDGRIPPSTLLKSSM